MPLLKNNALVADDWIHAGAEDGFPEAATSWCRSRACSRNGRRCRNATADWACISPISTAPRPDAVPAETVADRAALPRLHRRPRLFDRAADPRIRLSRRVARHRQCAARPAAVHAAGGLRCLRNRRALFRSPSGGKASRQMSLAYQRGLFRRGRRGGSVDRAPSRCRTVARTAACRMSTVYKGIHETYAGLEGRDLLEPLIRDFRGRIARRLILRRRIRRAAAHGFGKSTRHCRSSFSTPASCSGRRSAIAAC